jgi:CheY-like chemotaxis protein
MAYILIADDEEPLRHLLHRFLQAQGYQVYTAADGAEALRLGKKYLEQIDLLIADIRMPGLEGTEVARLLKASKADLKVLLISGYTEGRSVCEPFLSKPFAPAALLEKVRQLLAPVGNARPANP